MTEFKVVTTNGCTKTFVRENDAVAFWRYLKRVGIAATLIAAIAAPAQARYGKRHHVPAQAQHVERVAPVERAPYVSGVIVVQRGGRAAAGPYYVTQAPGSWPCKNDCNEAAPPKMVEWLAQREGSFKRHRAELCQGMGSVKRQLECLGE